MICLEKMGSDSFQQIYLVIKTEKIITIIENSEHFQKQAKAHFWSLYNSFLWIYEDISLQ